MRYREQMSATPTGSRRVAAGAMVFDGWDIAPAVIAHLVSQGITDFYLVDHRSQGTPLDSFARQIPSEATIHWARKESPFFSQASTTTALAHLARQDGFEAFVPFDVDEFFTGHDRPLYDEILEWLDTDTTRSLRCPMVNFFQSRDVEEFTPQSLESSRYSAVTGAKPLEYLLDIDPEFRRYPFSRPRYKTVMRLVSGLDGDYDWLTNGNHHVTSVATGERHTATVSNTISVLHLPFRSRDGIVARRGTALRMPSAGGLSIETGDREFSMAMNALLREWEMASAPADTTVETIEIGGVTAVRDDRLANLTPDIIARLRPMSSPPVSVIDETARLSDTAQDIAMAALELSERIRTAAVGKPGVAAKRSEDDRAYRNLERKIVELQKTIDTMRPSFVQRLRGRLRRR